MKKLPLNNLSYAILIGAVALSGCGSSDDRKESHTDGHDDHNHDGHIDANAQKEVNQGRLIMTDKDAKKAYVYSLAQKKVIQTLDIAHAGSDIYASPEKRFALLRSRNNNHTGFINSGLSLEDHGDHKDPKAVNASLSKLTLAQAKPTHYQYNEGVGVLFFDGEGNEGNPLDKFKQPAGFSVLTDEQIASNQQPLHFTLANNMHGTAEPRFSKKEGNFVLATQRVKTTGSVLADKVALYEVTDKIREKQVFTPDCKGLHGSASNEDTSVFACSDSVLSISRNGKTFTAKSIAYKDALKSIECKDSKGNARAVRIGSFKAHEAVADFVGVACGQPVWVNPKTDAIKTLTWTSDKTAKVVHYAYSQDGKTLLILDNKGKVHFADVASGYQIKASADVFGEAIKTEGHGGPQLVLNGTDMAYVLNDHDKEVYVIDINDQKKVDTIKLSVFAKGMAWVSAIGEHEHGHDHK